MTMILYMHSVLEMTKKMALYCQWKLIYITFNQDKDWKSDSRKLYNR